MFHRSCAALDDTGSVALYYENGRDMHRGI